MAKALLRLSLAVLGLGLALAGCSPGPMVEQLPTALGGLPSSAPQPPAKRYRFPAVHDAPPPRVTAPLTAEQQLQMENELQTVRDRQESTATSETEINSAPPDKNRSKAAKKHDKAGAADKP